MTLLRGERCEWDLVPAPGRAGLSGLDFHDREGFTTPWSIKVFAIMKARGYFMIAKTFTPFSGVKPFVIMRNGLTVR